jgi:hypothetical protein
LHATNFLALKNFLTMNNFEIVLDINKQLMSSNLHLPILHTELALYLIGLIARCQTAIFITKAVLRTYLAPFVLQAIFKKTILRDVRVFLA